MKTAYLVVRLSFVSAFCALAQIGLASFAPPMWLWPAFFGTCFLHGIVSVWDGPQR